MTAYFRLITITSFALWRGLTEARLVNYMNEDPACTEVCDWMQYADGVEMDCVFKFRFGLHPHAGLSQNKTESGPALLLRLSNNLSYTIGPHDQSLFLKTPIICERERSSGISNSERKPIVLLMVASSLDYLFRLWPYFIQKVVWADSMAMRLALWIGELPLGVAQTVSEDCQQSEIMSEFLNQHHHANLRRRHLLASSYYKERSDHQSIINSNHYIKMLATYAILRFASPHAGAVWYVDMDSTVKHQYSFANASSIQQLNSIHTSKKASFIDVLFFSGSYSPTYFFWQVKGHTFYIRNSIFGRRFIAAWLHWRCISHDQIALWHTILKLADEAGCVKYDGQIFQLTYHDARSRKRRHLPPTVQLNTTFCQHQCPPHFGYGACSPHLHEFGDLHSASPIHHTFMGDHRPCNFSYFDSTSYSFRTVTVESMVPSTHLDYDDGGLALLEALNLLPFLGDESNQIY